MIPASDNSVMYRYLTSMCFVRESYIGFSVNELAPLLSPSRIVGLRGDPISRINAVIHCDSFAASVAAINSASVDDKAKMSYFFDRQEIGPPKK